MGKDLDKTSEDLYADTDFGDDDDSLKDAKFISGKADSIKIEETSEEKLSKFYGAHNKLLGERIIEKKTGEITEIKYNILGLKERIIIRYKNKKVKKSTDYYENGSLKLVTNYAPDGSYKSTAYNVDGSRQSYVEKHSDLTADAIYFDVNKSGANLVMKLDANKKVIEKHLEG